MSKKLPVSKEKMLPAPRESGKLSLTKRTRKQLLTFFGDKSEDLLEMLEYGNTDGAITLLSKNLLATCIDVLPILENQVRASDGARGTFGFNQMISSIREQIADLQALQDRSLVAERIVERVVRPAYQSIAVQITIALTDMVEQARTRMDREDLATFRSEADAIRNKLSDFMLLQYKEIEEGVRQSLT